MNNNQEAVKEGRNGLLIDERNGPTNDGTLPHPKINIIMEESCKFVLGGENEVKTNGGGVLVSPPRKIEELYLQE